MNCNIVNETELILKALSSPIPNAVVRKKRVMRELDPEPENLTGTDPVIRKLGQKIRRQTIHKTRPLHQWTNSDFVRYIYAHFKTVGIQYDASLRDREIIGQIYDKLAFRLKELMNNTVLKEYIDWWLGSHGAISQERIWIGKMAFDNLIEKFVSRFAVAPVTKEENPSHVVESDISPETIYEMGGSNGLLRLLLSTGIVVTSRVLKSKRVSVLTISDALRKLNKDMLCQVIRLTLKNAPYNVSDKVDFMAIAKPALDFHGIKEFAGISYTESFAK